MGLMIGFHLISIHFYFELRVMYMKPVIQQSYTYLLRGNVTEFYGYKKMKTMNL